MSVAANFVEKRQRCFIVAHSSRSRFSFAKDFFTRQICPALISVSKLLRESVDRSNKVETRGREKGRPNAFHKCLSNTRATFARASIRRVRNVARGVTHNCRVVYSLRDVIVVAAKPRDEFSFVMKTGAHKEKFPAVSDATCFGVNGIARGNAETVFVIQLFASPLTLRQRVSLDVN